MGHFHTSTRSLNDCCLQASHSIKPSVVSNTNWNLGSLPLYFVWVKIMSLARGGVWFEAQLQSLFSCPHESCARGHVCVRHVCVHYARRGGCSAQRRGCFSSPHAIVAVVHAGMCVCIMRAGGGAQLGAEIAFHTVHLVGQC